MLCPSIIFELTLLTEFNLNKFTDQPDLVLPDETVNKPTQAKWLLDVCEAFVNKYVFEEGDIDSLVQQTHQLELASLGHYECRAEDCDKVFVYHSARVR